MTNHPRHQVYDSTLKGLFGEQATWIVPYLLPMAQLEATPLGAEEETEAQLNIEINRTTLKADLLYKALYKYKHIILVIELQTGHDKDLQRRLMAYHGSLHLQYNKPVLILVIYLFEEGPEDLSYQDDCQDEVFASIHPKVIRLRDLESEQIVRDHQLSLYTLLPATKRPAVRLLKQALKEMYEHYDDQQFINYTTWFICMMDRTTTMSDEEKQSIEEVLQVQYQIDPLIRENPRIRAIAAESEAKGRIEGKAEGLIEGIQEMILDLVSDRFPALVVSQVQQTIAPSQDIEQLKRFHRQLARVSDEQEVPALLAQCFPLQHQIDPLIRENPRIRAIAAESEAKGRIEGEAKGLREAILNILHVRFVALAITTQAQQAMAHIQDIEKLKELQRDLLLAPDERTARALLELPPQADLL